MMTMSSLIVFCDKEEDTEFYSDLASMSEVLRQYNPVTLPQSNRAPAFLQSLIAYDRPDYIFVVDDQPVLVVELTEHGYTGDNGLQRFPRIAKSASLGIPSVFMIPYARSRLNELRAHQNHPRNVTQKFFEGLLEMGTRFRAPQITLRWPVNEKNMAAKVPASNPEFQTIYRSLVTVIEHILETHVADVLTSADFRDCPLEKAYLDAMRNHVATLAANSRPTEVCFTSQTFDQISAVYTNPRSFLNLIGLEYFMKGKLEKILALEAIRQSEGHILPDIPDALRRGNWVLLYSGYEYRSEPLGGVVRSTYEALVSSGQHEFMALYWPRVFAQRDHPVRAKLLDELRALGDQSPTSLDAAIRERTRGKSIRALSAKSNKFGVLQKASTVGRIVLDTVDLLILNDAVLLGHRWVR